MTPIATCAECRPFIGQTVCSARLLGYTLLGRHRPVTHHASLITVAILRHICRTFCPPVCLSVCVSAFHTRRLLLYSLRTLHSSHCRRDMTSVISAISSISISSDNSSPSRCGRQHYRYSSVHPAACPLLAR